MGSCCWDSCRVHLLDFEFTADMHVQGSNDVPVPNVGSDVDMGGNLDKGQFKSEMGADANANTEPLGP